MTGHKTLAEIRADRESALGHGSALLSGREAASASPAARPFDGSTAARLTSLDRRTGHRCSGSINC